MSSYQFRKPNSYPLNGGSWGQGHPSSYGDPPPYTSVPPVSDFEDHGGFDTPYQDKPGWSQVAGHHGSFPMSMRPGRSTVYPGSDNAWRQHPGMSSGTRCCQQCGTPMPMYGQGDEWGGSGREGMGMGGFGSGYPYGQAQTQQHGTMRCPSCGYIQTPNPYSGFQPGGGTFPLAQTEDMYDAPGPYGHSSSSFSGHHPRAEWPPAAGGFQLGGHQLNNGIGMAYQQQRPHTSMGTRDYHRQQRHQAPYSHSGAYDFQDPYQTMDGYDYGNQGMPGGGYSYGMPGMGMQGPARRGRHGDLASYQYSSSLHFSRNPGGMPGLYGGEYGQ